jgi:hypothetical protein
MSTTFDVDRVRRAKAANLADAFFADCRFRLANIAAAKGQKATMTDAGIVARAGEQASDGVWYTIADKAGIRKPSHETIDMAKRFLRHRATTGQDPFVGMGCL